MEIDQQGIDFIKQQEGLRLEVYADVAGHLTVGYGHKDDSMTLGDVITQDQADQFLQDDLQVVQSAIDSLVTVTITQSQFDALCSFIFNIGVTKFAGSTLRTMINDSAPENAIQAQIKLWCHSGGVVVEDLVNRRNLEAQMWGF